MFFRHDPETGRFYLDPAALAARCDAADAVALRCVLDCPAVRRVLARLEGAEAPCLCCRYVAGGRRAAALSCELGAALRYLRAGFRGTGHEARCAAALQEPYAPPRGVRPAAAARAATRAAARCGVALHFCPREGRAWFSRPTAEAERAALARLLRRAAKRLKKVGGVLRVAAPSLAQVAALPAPGNIQSVAVLGVDAPRFLEAFASAASAPPAASAASAAPAAAAAAGTAGLPRRPQPHGSR